MNIADWLMANGDSLQFTLFFALLGALMVAERWLPRRRGSMDRAFRWPANGFLTLVNLVAMTALPVSFISAALWAGSNGIGVLNLVPLPWMAIAPVTLLVRAFISFATHYLNHHVAWFWRVHRVHHLDTERTQGVCLLRLWAVGRRPWHRPWAWAVVGRRGQPVDVSAPRSCLGRLPPTAHSLRPNKRWAIAPLRGSSSRNPRTTGRCGRARPCGRPSRPQSCTRCP